MISRVMNWTKNIKDNNRITGLSTPFIGISWENINKIDKQDILRELYLIRKKISKFYFSYYDSLLRLDEEEIRDTYFLRAFQVHSEIAELVLTSNFFVMLPIENREMFLEVFDFVTMQEVYIENDADYYMEPEDIQIMIDDLLNLFSTINNKISDLNNVK